MNKEARLVIRMTPEFRAWIDTMADADELDSSSWVRLQLAHLRNGRSQKEPVILPGRMSYRPIHDENEYVPEPFEPQQLDQLPINPDDLVAAALATAEAQSLTEPPQQNEIVPQAGTRALKRPPVPFSPANQPGWIQGQ